MGHSFPLPWQRYNCNSVFYKVSICALTILLPLQAATSADFFEQKVRPVLAKRCYACHAAVQTAGLRVDSLEAMLAGGKSGRAIVPGDPARSLLIQAVRHENAKLKMPPQGKLEASEIEALESWVRDGAVWPTASVKSGGLWSAGPLVKPTVNSIDDAVQLGIASKGLKRNAPASKRALLRRLTFDLIGLPPTPEEMDAFLADSSPRAAERVVDSFWLRRISENAGRAIGWT